MGSDRTTFVLRQGRVVDAIKILSKLDTMEVVGHVVAVLDPWRVDIVRVDLIGVGSGVFDRLAELKRLGRIQASIEGVDVSAQAPPKAPADDMQAHRLRDYLWMQTAAWLRDEAPVFAADDRESCEDLAGELTSVRYTFSSDGALHVEDSDAMKKRVGHSPDLARGLILTFAPAPPGVPAVNLAPALEGMGWRSPIAGSMRTSRPRQPDRIWRDDMDDDDLYR
jgi:hypothetical protein